MNNLEAIINANPDETFLKADGFDDAVIGIDRLTGRLIYSSAKCIATLMKGGMDFEGAIEYFDFNVVGAYVGEMTPIWCWDLDIPTQNSLDEILDSDG